jgi:hypothetical protein
VTPRARRLALAVSVLGLLLLASTATAERAKDGRRIIGILDVTGPTPDVARSFEAGLEAQLATGHVWLVSRASMRERLKASTRWTDGCLVGTCLAELRVQTRAEVVLEAALTGSGTSFGFVVTLVRTDTGRVLSQESDRCDVCTLNEAMTTAMLATVKLVNALPDQLPDEAAAQGAAAEVAANTVRKQLVAERRGHRRTGLVLTLIGLAAVGAGSAIYFRTDDRPSYGLGTAAGGIGLVLGGVVVLTF